MQLAVYQALATELHCVHHVCEIGLNAGHSASTWLYSRPDIQLSSFDNGQHKSAFAVTRFFLDRFPGRVSVRFGDSKISIQHAAALHHGACDLLLIDGGHDYPTAKADLISMHQLANATFNLVVFDDVECPEWYCEEPQQALDEVLKEGVVKQVWKIGLNVSGWGRGFFVGQYQF